MKILLIDAGNMGGAILKGLQTYDVMVVETNQSKNQCQA